MSSMGQLFSKPKDPPMPANPITPVDPNATGNKGTVLTTEDDTKKRKQAPSGAASYFQTASGISL